MKILIHNRNPKSWVGGDAIQVNNTIETLKNNGIEVDFTSDTFKDPRDYDLVHIFHINFFWTTPMMQECQKHKVPYIISTIYFDREYDNSFGTMSKLASKAQKLIALSNNEKIELMSRLNVPEEKIEVIPNGVDKNIFFNTDNHNRDGVIAIGRLIDRSKGAEFVINACSELNIPLIYIGASDTSKYADQLKRKCTHIEYLDQFYIAQLMNKSKVYVCSSLSERQSLGVLEAKACGCNIVDSIFNRGADLLPSSIVVDPTDNKALKKAIRNQLKSYSQPDYVPSWDDVAKMLINVYSRII